MIFSEIYGSYYKAMTEILKIAVSSGGSAALKDIRLWGRLSGNNHDKHETPWKSRGFSAF